MSTLTYRGISIDVVDTEEYSKSPVYDARGTYLYTRVRLVVRGVASPVTTSYRRVAAEVDAGPTAVQAFGQRGATTETAIRHALTQPRGILVYTIGNVEVLRSPAVTEGAVDGHAPCDANNGPLPIEGPTIFRVIGNKTCLVRWGVETYINECRSGPGDRTDARQKRLQAALLSSTWSRREVIDQDYFSTIITRGRAVFRPDFLKFVRYPDDYRHHLLHPVPRGFKRDRVDVLATEEGTVLEYELVDREQLFVYGQPNDGIGITRVEGTHTSGVVWLGPLNNVTNVVGTIISAGQTILAMRGGDMSRGQGILKIGRGGVELAQNLLPTVFHNIVVRVWGQRTTLRRRMAPFALRVMAKRIPREAQGWLASTVELTEDLVGSFVEVRGVFQRPRVFEDDNFDVDGVNIPNPAAHIRAENREGCTGFLNNTSLRATEGRGPTRQGARSHFYQTLVTKALQDPCTAGNASAYFDRPPADV